MLNFAIFFITLMSAILGSSPAFSSVKIDLCSDRNPPVHLLGNVQLKALFTYCPKLDHVSIGRDSTHNLFAGQWYDRKKPTLGFYSQTDEGLNIALGGSVSTVNMSSKKGLLPLLPGSSGFYIEFLARIDSDSMDHWPALWLNPIEHNAKEDDRSFSYRRRSQHWMELDVDEGGFQSGMFGTVIEWQGNHPDYRKSQNKHPVAKDLDRTVFHTFSAYYDPVKGSVTWWVDGELHNKVPAPVIGSKYNYYFTMGAQTHGKNEPYKLIVKRVRAFVPM